MSYLALPCHEQPTTQYTYYVISTYGWSDQNSQFLIVGCTDNTNITIIPNNNITVPADPQVSGSANIRVNPGQQYNFTLNSMQTFFVFEPYVDLTGTKIISSKPLSIISGHEASRVPQSFFDADPIVTQLVPTITWGKTFILPPHVGRNNGQSYKIIAASNNTKAVQTCGTPIANNVLAIPFDSNNTYWFNTSVGIYCSIISDKPIIVYQVGVSTNYNGGTLGDPSLNTVPPIEQYDNLVQFTTFSQATSYYSVVVPNDIYFNGQLRINGFIQNITFSQIFQANGSVIGYGHSASISGTNTIQHPASNGKIFLSVYGWTTYGGYAYTGGMKLNPIYSDNSIAEISFTNIEYTVSEGEGMVYVSIERLKEFDANISIRVYTSPTQVDTALISQDYTAIDVILYFNGSDTDLIQNVSIPIVNDMYAEPTEYFTVRMESLTTDDAVFPITETVIKITDDDIIQVGFTSDQSVIDDDMATVRVQITSGSLEPDTSLPFILMIGIDGGESSPNLTCELSSLHPWNTFGFDLTQFSSYNPNITQNISANLWLPQAIRMNATVSSDVITIIPVPIELSSTMLPMLTSTDQFMTTSDICPSPSPSPMSSIPPSTFISTVTDTVTTTNNVTITQYSTITDVSSMAICPSSVTVTPSTSTTTIVNVVTTTSVSTSFIVTTTTQFSTLSDCLKTSSSNKSESQQPTATTRPNVNALTQNVPVPSGALYFGIVGFIIVIVVVIVISIFCCIFLYYKGKKKGRKLEIKLERDMEMSANNPLYYDPQGGDNSSLYSSVKGSLDEKQLLQYMQ
jgi:hypothetical protein